MTQNMSTEPPQVLLHMLCSRITGLKGESLTPHYKIAMAALSSSISNPVENDEFKIAERIKKKLVKRGSAKDCAIFSELHQKMKARSILKNRSAVLALLYCLSGDTSESSKTFQSNAFNLGLTQCMTSTPFVTGRQKNANAGDTMTSGSTMLRSTSGEMTTAAALRSASSAGSSGISSITASSASGRGDVTKVMVVPPSSLPLRSGMMTTSLPSHVTPNVTNKGYIPKPGFSTVRTSSAVEVANRNDAVTADNTSFEIPETRLLRDVLYICQGIEGTYIKYDTNREGFKVDAKAGITWSVRQHLLRLAECGWLHNKVRRYADSRSTDRAFGLVGQSFCTALHQELTEYYKLIAVLEAQLDSADGCSALTLRRVAVWTCEPRVRLRMLAALVDICHAQKGGALASAIHSYIQHGDPAVRALVQHTLALVSQPIYSTIMTWIYDGQLEDTYHEFFVASDPTVKDDRLWHDKYSLRKSMIPSFLTMDQANKVLLSGKSINFLRQVCQDRTAIRNRLTSAHTYEVESIFMQSQDGVFQQMIDTIYKETSKHLLEVLHEKYQFMDHLKAMRRYLLLGQGDFIRHLMDLLEEDLAKPAATLFLHRLTGILDQAIRATNAQYDDADILKRIDVRLLEVSPGDTGWDVFSLDYHVDGPIRTVFTPECMIMYLRVFNFLWRAKRMEYTLSAIWKCQNHNARQLRAIPELQPVLHQCHVIGAEMVHFVQQVQYYINFEVLECSWHELARRVGDAEDLDHIIAAHQMFLDTIIARSLLDNQSTVILTQLRTIFDLVIQFQTIQEKLYLSAFDELQCREAYEQQAAASADKGDWGKTEQSEQISEARKCEFRQTVLATTRSQLRVVAQSYQNMTQQFLVMLTGHSDMNLRFLSFRLDFNEHYKMKEPNLRSPMAYLKAKRN